MMNMFDEIEKEKKELPKIRSIQKEVNEVELNIYQKLTIIIFMFCVFLGVAQLCVDHQDDDAAVHEYDAV